MSHEFILTRSEGRVGLVQLNRPQALNALNRGLMSELMSALEAFDADDGIGCLVITGSEKAFAAGADIKEMANATPATMLNNPFIDYWDRLRKIGKPVIAAVSGFALGGGCELAMMCDLIYAADNAKFGQPEIKLGLIPGMGGSQRLTKLVGKAKAMDMLLTGRMMDAAEAERAGLVARVIPAADLMAETLSAAEMIGCWGKTAVIAAREAVERAQEGSLREGLLFERRTYYALWATADANEGMQAFLEKRTPVFSGR